ATGFTVTPAADAPSSTRKSNGATCSSGWYASTPVSVSLAATDSGSGVDRILYSTDGSAPSLVYSGPIQVATTSTVKFAAVDKVGKARKSAAQGELIDARARSAPALSCSAL